MLETYANKKVLITGGLGFLGSNMAIKLVNDCQARVTILDCGTKRGGGYRNISAIKNKVKIVCGDITNKDDLMPLLNVDYVFHCAGQTQYLYDSNMVFSDLKVNVAGTLDILELFYKYNRDVKIGFASTRFVYGKIRVIPVEENHPAEPINIYGIHKLTAEHYMRFYSILGLKTFIIRIPNPYGPRQQIKTANTGIVGWFLGQAMQGKELKIYGDGLQKRDYIYIDDVVDAFLLAGASELTNGEVFNIGSPAGMTFKEMVKAVAGTVGHVKVKCVPWPSNYEINRTGDYIADYSKIERITGWRPRIEFEEGIKRMHDYYSEHEKYYL